MIDKCAKCGEEKEIVCTVDGKAWCEGCFDKAMGCREHFGKENQTCGSKECPYQAGGNCPASEGCGGFEEA